MSGFLQKEVTPRVASIREGAESRLDKLLRREDGAADQASGGDLLKNSQRVWEEWQRRMDDRVKQVVEGVAGSLPALGRDLQTLLDRLAELEKKVAELEREKQNK